VFRRIAFVRLLVSLALSAALAACGGGGGGGGEGEDDSPSGPTIAVRYNITNFNFGVPAGGDVFTSVTATLSPVPEGKVYVYVVADKPVLKTGATTVSRNANGSYTAYLQIDPSLVVGKYTGTLTLQLCQDAACAKQYALSGASLPYSIDVVAPLAVSVTANGVPVALSNGFFYRVHAGETVTVTSNVSTVWGQPTNVSTGGTGSLSAVSTTPTTWTATVSGTSTMVELRATSAQYGTNLKLVYLEIE